MTTRPTPTIHWNTKQIIIKPCLKIEGGRDVVVTPLSDLKKAKNGTTVEETKTVTTTTKEYTEAVELVAVLTKRVHDSASQFPDGYMVAWESKAQFDKMRAEVLKECEAFNKKHTVQITGGEGRPPEVWHIAIELKVTPALVLQVNESVKQSLIKLRDSLLDVDDSFKNARTDYNALRSKADLAAGVQADSLRYALEKAKTVIQANKPAQKDALETFDAAISIYSVSDSVPMPEEL